jgi:Predicted hydrolases or acyltransferases (alpha/beta hydrolase superfamily)
MYINCNGVSLYYEVSGQGAPIILIHGCTETHRIFDMLVPQLEKDYTVYAVDTRGPGSSEKVKELHYDDMAADYAAFIKALGLENPTVIGFSDGGIISLLLAIKHKDSIGKAIACGPNLTPDGNKPKVQKWFKWLYIFSRSKYFKLMLTEPNISLDELKKIDIPIHVIGGERDMIKTEHMLEIAENIKGATYEQIAGSSHGGYIVHNPAFYGIVKKYL